MKPGKSLPKMAFFLKLGWYERRVIGALAAVGLMAAKNDGRVIYCGASGQDWYDVTGRWKWKIS